jgi:hypothetical protein
MQGTMLRVVLVGLMLLLSGCVALGAPPKMIIQQALQLQVEQTQQALSQQLQLPSPQIEIRKLQLGDRTALKIDDLSAYRIRGQFDLQISQGRRRQKTQQAPFEVFLQRQTEGKTWRLAVPTRSRNALEQAWQTYALPLPTDP